MKKKETKNISLKDIDRLLAQQTTVILSAVDVKLRKNKEDFKKEINSLKISVDKFVGFYTKQEQEFTLMNAHIRRLEERVSKLEAKMS